MDSNITKPGVIRLARQAGIKSIADDCHDVVRGLIEAELSRVISGILVANDERSTKTIMVEDVYNAFNLNGVNLVQTDCL